MNNKLIIVIIFSSAADPSAPNVQVTRLTLMCETAPNPLTLDLQGESQFTQVYKLRQSMF